MPLAYPRIHTTRPALADIRRRPLTGAFKRYLVFYRVANDGDVNVVRLLHSARDLDRILGEQ